MIDISFKNKTGLKPEILSAIIGSDSFFYGFFSEDFKLLECQHYSIGDFADQEIIDKVKDDIFNIQNIKIKVSSTSKPYLHSNVEEAGKALKFFPAFLNKDNLDNKFTDQDVIVEYGLTKSQSHFLNGVLNNQHQNFHISTVLSNYFYPFSKKQLIAYVEDEKLHLLYGKDTKFLFYNQFNCTHENDYLYFITLIYDQLKLNREEDNLLLFGRLDLDFPLHDLLHGYFRNVEFTRSERLHITDFRYRAKQHFYLDLFATALCE
ncbi:MAG: DUF3822 family protein [Bacteroidota bacterium]